MYQDRGNKNTSKQVALYNEINARLGKLAETGTGPNEKAGAWLQLNAIKNQIESLMEGLNAGQPA